MPTYSCKILTWNVFLRKRYLFPDGQIERTKQIIQEWKTDPLIQQLDLIVLIELFDETCTKMLQEALHCMGFIHQTNVLGDEHRATTKTMIDALMFEQRAYIFNGGVFMASRHPMPEIQYQYWDTDEGTIAQPDSLTAKGFIYVKLAMSLQLPSQKQTTIQKNVHVIGTHFQSVEGKMYDEIRNLEANKIHSFIQSLCISPHEPVLITGDLNQGPSMIDHSINRTWKRLLDTMHAQNLTSCLLESPAIDSRYNDLVGRDGYKCSSLTSHFDHCLYSTDHLHPIDSQSVICALKTESYLPITFGIVHMPLQTVGRTTTHQLSDHYPIVANFVFLHKERGKQRRRNSQNSQNEGKSTSTNTNYETLKTDTLNKMTQMISTTISKFVDGAST